MTFTLITFSLGLLVALVLCDIRRRSIQRDLDRGIERHKENEEKQAADHATKIRQLLDAVQVGLIIATSDGRLRWTNEEAQRLFGTRSVKDRLIEEVFLASQFVDLVREGIDTGQPLTRQVTLPAGALSGDFADNSGETHWIVEITPVASPIPPTEFLVALRDNTQSARSDQIRTDFVANASHELRTPLTTSTVASRTAPDRPPCSGRLHSPRDSRGRPSPSPRSRFEESPGARSTPEGGINPLFPLSDLLSDALKDATPKANS